VFPAKANTASNDPGHLTGSVARTDMALVIPRAVRPRDRPGRRSGSATSDHKIALMPALVAQLSFVKQEEGVPPFSGKVAGSLAGFEDNRNSTALTCSISLR